MAGNSIEINSNVNDINIQPDFNKITVVNPDGCFVTITQPVTNVIQVATPGPQGQVGPVGPPVVFDSGSYVTTSSFNAFTSSIQTEVDNLTAQTGSYVLNSQTGSFATTGSNNFIGNQIITGSLTVSGSSTFTNIGPSIFSGSITVTNGNIISNGNATLLGSLTANSINVKTTTNTATLLSDTISGSFNYYFPPNSGGTLVLRDELPRAGNGLTDTIGFPSTISLGGSVTNNITLTDTSGSYIFITEGLGHQIKRISDSSGPSLDFQRAAGVPGSPNAPQANQYLGILGAGAATLSESGRSAAIIFQATSDFTSGSKGSSIGFYTTPSGSNLSSRVMTVSDDAQVGIGTRYPTNTLHVSGSGKFTDELVVEGSVTASSIYVSSSIETDTLKVRGGTGNEGTFAWNSVDNTVDLQLNNVTLQLGQETVYHVINQTGTQINNGEVVYVTGVSSDKLSVAPYSASMDIEADLVLGLATEDIPDTQFGFITQFGMVRELNTTGFGIGTPLYADTGSSGYTDIAPTPPDHTIFLGFVTREDATEGQIELNVRHLRDADEIKTNLSGSGLSSTNVQAALLELQANKVNVGALSSNIILYPTTGSSPIPGYFRMVSDITDPDYNTTPVDINTGAISSLSGQLIASLASDEGLFVGNPGIINVTTLGNIRKVSGNRDAYFYYELYQSSSSGETLIATSDNTPDITNTSYEEFFASALLNNGIWSATDRVVIKYYGVKATSGGNDPTYQFQFGGAEPVRTLLPVPVSVVPSENADGIQTDTSNFNNILSGGDTDVQKALDTLDDHSHTLQEITDQSNITTDRIIVGDLTVDTDVLYTSGSNVGIGTTNLPEKLTVEGNISASAFIGDGSQLTGIVSSSYALTASYAENAGGGAGFPFEGDAVISGSLLVNAFSTTSQSLSVIGSGSTVFDVIGSVGTLFSVDDDLTGTLFSVNDISGFPILEASASGEVYIGKSPQSLYTTAIISSTTAATTHSLSSLSTSSYDGAFFEYTAHSGSNARAGNIMSTWNGGNIVYTETNTLDIGDTSDLTTEVIISGSTARLVAYGANAGYKIKTIIKAI